MNASHSFSVEANDLRIVEFLNQDNLPIPLQQILSSKPPIVSYSLVIR